MKIYYFLLLTFLCTSATCQQRKVAQVEERELGETTYFSPDLYDFDTVALLERVKYFASDELEGRRTESPGNAMAAEFIQKEFKRVHLDPFGNGFQRSFEFKDRSGILRKGNNIIGYKQGLRKKDQYIVITAHYDHLGKRDGAIFNGADDNASGTSALIALAEEINRNPSEHSIIFAAVDAEEMGLQGARAFVKNPPVPLGNIVLNINLDMLGRNDRNELYVSGTSYSPYLREYITDDITSKSIKLIHGHDGEDGKQNWTFSSDHGPFHQKGIPFLYFGVEDHKDYHKESDEFSGIQPAFYREVVRMIYQAVGRADVYDFK